VLLRFESVRGVNLNVFEFDYDVTWMGFFLTADEQVLGRFGGRDEHSPSKYHSLPALRYAMTSALRRYREGSPEKPAARPVAAFRPEQFPAARERPARSCIHCHHVNEFRRANLQSKGKRKAEDLYQYPVPENLGFSVTPDQGNRVRKVRPGSAADHSGLRPGDVVHSIDGLPVASFADVQHALHRAPRTGAMAVNWERGGSTERGTVTLAEGWRKTDLSWRWSLQSLRPAPGLRGEDLTFNEKKALGLDPGQLAFRQGSFVGREAERAGVRQNDIILDIDDRRLQMTARQFDVYVRLNYRPGQPVVVHLLRDGRRLNLPMRLPE
jgi:S1-C subfamily serine protease